MLNGNPARIPSNVSIDMAETLTLDDISGHTMQAENEEAQHRKAPLYFTHAVLVVLAAGRATSITVERSETNGKRPETA